MHIVLVLNEQVCCKLAWHEALFHPNQHMVEPPMLLVFMNMKTRTM